MNHDRDRDIVLHLLRYCRETEQAIARFGDHKAVFMEDAAGIPPLHAFCEAYLQKQ